MATPFRQTIRSLERGRGRPWWVVGVALLLLATWLLWFSLAEVAVYKTSVSGRIESTAEARPVQAPVTGTVVDCHLELGRRFRANDVLVELDATAQRLELRERQARLAGLESDVQILKESVETASALVAELQREADLTVREAETSIRGARADRLLAARERDRHEKLEREGLSSRQELDRVQTRSESLEANLATLQVRADRLRASGLRQLEESRVALGEAQHALARARSDVEVERAAIERLEHEIERRTLRAPVAGTVGALGTARVGALLREGEQAALLVPDGELRAVAHFRPLEVGLLRPGQPVVLRFPAYPSTAYGSLRGRVAAVASEAVDRRVRVDIDLETDRRSPIPLEHGEEVVAEVTVEKIAPLRLLLRSIGVLLEGRGEDDA